MSNDIANHIAEATRNNNLSTSAINEYPYWVQSIMADEEETLAVQENHSFAFHGATKAVDVPQDWDNTNHVPESPLHRSEDFGSNDDVIMQKFSLMEGKIKSLNSELIKVKSRVRDLEYTMDEQVDNIYVLEKQLNRLDQYGRRQNIELTGIPNEVNDRDLETEVLKILRAIGLVHIDHFSIVGCHRVASKDRFGRRNTIIRFLNRKDAILCLKSKRNLFQCKSLGYSNIYIIENLCPANKSIYDQLSHLKEEGIIKKIWTYNGIVNYKRTENEHEKPIKIFHEYDIDNIYNDIGI